MRREDERRIIERAIAGDRSAAGELVRLHQRSVYGYLLRMSGRPDVAEDIAQEAFVRVLANIERFDFRFRFSTWLFTIARRLFLNSVQKMKPAYDSDAIGRAPSVEGGETWTPASEDELRGVRRRSLDDAMAELSIEQREVLILFHQQDWPIALIAEHLDMPQGTVKSHLHRGRRRLKALLEERPRELDRMDVGDEGIGVRAAASPAALTGEGGVAS